MPINATKIFETFKDEPVSILAANTRIVPATTRAIFKACQETNAVIFIELAKSECNLEGGYTGLTPKLLSELTNKTAKELDFDNWALHSDHNTIKENDDPKEIKKLLKSQIDAGYTSFSIDTYPLLRPEKENLSEKLRNNLNATVEITNFIKENNKSDFGLETEFSQIAKNQSEIILTKPEEALIFIKKLKEKGIEPHALAISNGSIHGNVFDDKGNLVPQNEIDINLTHKIANVLRNEGLKTRIAQHGTSGIPLELIKNKLDKKDIIKINVSTAWQEAFFEILENKESLLFKEIYEFTLKKYTKKAQEENIINKKTIFHKFSKYSIVKFFEQLYNLDQKTLIQIEDKIFKLALRYIEALNLKNSANLLS